MSGSRMARGVRPAPILIICDRGLVGLVQHAVFEDQHVHLGAHEATVRILGRADDRARPAR